MPLKAVFFDIDGTLVDSNEFHVSAWHEAFHDAGIFLEKAAIRSQIGKGADQLIPALGQDIGPEARENVASRHGEIFRTRYLKQVNPFSHAADLVEMLHTQGTVVILASSAERAEVDHYVQLLKLTPAIAATITKDDVANSKPAGDIFAAALAQVFPVSASETLAVGDTPYDVESALRSSIRTVALRSGGFSEEVLGEAGAAYIYASVTDLFEKFAGSPLEAG